MCELIDKKVGQVVAENFQTAAVFSKYGIDFCCGGGLTIEKACENKEIDSKKLLEELLEANQHQDPLIEQHLSLTQIIDHIVSTHHSYVDRTLGPLKAYLQKIESVHGDRHPELHQVKQMFFEASDALTSHMKKEEFILFPYVKAMEMAKQKHFPLSAPHFGDIENPIHMMEEEHEKEGDRFNELAKITNNYTPPEDGCQTYQVAYAMLREFVEDLHTHIHLENNVLFPRATTLYHELN
ncbi:iron-sulfur cluster repair di-iron protein [Algoriphagus marinus]|uniref:iron-sulfur cluster repair di-iron protein n=1 Tax=Algoriphagus marinus TaxID=1925762 RepID=UPI00094B7A7E|nr:iron-sulfur cluster repair di-iron protein [Algoriphagus marinus]